MAAAREGSGHLSDETQDLLRGRLRAATLVLLVAAGMHFVRSRFVAFNPLPILHASVVLAIAAAYASLSSRKPLSLRCLRQFELALFGGTGALVLLTQYEAMRFHAVRQDSMHLLGTFKSTAGIVLSIMMTYAMLIPNSAARAARFVVPLAIIPAVMTLLLAAIHPELRPVLWRVITIEQISEVDVMLVMGMVLAIYGSHVIHALRTEAFEARRLGQYRLGRRLGSGGMGEVYLAEHQLLKRPCAVKLIRPDRAGDPRALARFEREVRSTAQLSHPNTVEIYDYGHTPDGTFYYVMEYLPGLSLADLVERHGPLPPGRVVYLLRQACEALAEAHAAGLVHRDLKPANIFAARRGGRHDVAKLLDFGLVKPVSEPSALALSGDGLVAGSPLYMSPEQADDGRVPDARSDIYALGAVAYDLLTGRPPFEGRSAMAVLVAHARDPVVPPSRLEPTVPPDLEAVVLRCLAKDPEDRYPDAEALGLALAQCECAADWDARRAACWWAGSGEGAGLEESAAVA